MEVANAKYPSNAADEAVEKNTSRIIVRTTVAHVAFRVLKVRFKASHSVCFPGFRSSPPSPAETATNRSRAVLAPPSCIVA
jgi:hypothetical protein